MDNRCKWVEELVCKGMSLDQLTVEQLISDELTNVKQFFDSKVEGKAMLFFVEVDKRSNSRKVCLGFDCLPDNPSAKTMYFVKISPESVRNPASMEQASEVMVHFLEYGIVSGLSLKMLEMIIKDVYMPMTDTSLASSVDDVSSRPESEDLQQTDMKVEGISDTVRNEFSINMQKFVSQICHTIQQVSTNVKLDLPNVKIDPNNLRAAAQDEEIVSKLVDKLEEWIKQINAIIQKQNGQKAGGEGPIAEINFWRDRNAEFSALYEQLNTEQVKNMLKVMEMAEIDAMVVFNKNMGELLKLFVEAKDNVKFLTTLERHFKNLAGGNLAVMQETIPSMMTSLRLVWIISRHYNKDSCMFPLMERIANEIADKVAKKIDLKTIFHRPPEEIMRTIKKGHEVLDLWFSQYVLMRDKIEASGSQHWEFNRNKLFDRTFYMSKICKHLLKVAETLDQFNKFLGPEFKSVVSGDPKAIDDVIKRVKDLINPLEALPYNIFLTRWQDPWDQQMKEFDDKVRGIEDRTSQIIDISFKKLRSAEGAFNLLQNFKNIESRESISQQMMEKFADILSQYSKEVKLVHKIFQDGQGNPPVSKNEPPVAGAIAWSRSLYHRIKKPALKFNLLASATPEGKAVCREYVQVAKVITSFEENMLSEWTSQAIDIAKSKLKEPIFTKETVTKRTQKPGSAGGGDGKSPNAVHEEVEERIIVNFAPELKEMIRETKYLDRMGLAVPVEAQNVALQDKKYYDLVEKLNSMLNNYAEVIQRLSDVERKLLENKIKELQEELHAGEDNLNWNSLGIPDFIQECNKQITKFETMVNQVLKNSTLISDWIEVIRQAKLVDIQDFATRIEVTTVEDLVDQLEKHRNSVLLDLQSKYNSIIERLKIIERTVCETETGICPQMVDYYKYWEIKIYNALTSMVATGLTNFQNILSGEVGQKKLPTAFDETRLPLIKVVADMTNPPNITVSPNIQDIYKILTKLIRNITESAKSLTRWMDESCLPAKPVKIPDKEEELVYTFYDDIKFNRLVVDMARKVTGFVCQVIFNIQQKILDWGKYNEEYQLWNSKKNQKLDRLRQRTNPTAYFDKHLEKYSQLRRDINQRDMKMDIEFIRVDVSGLIGVIRDKAQDWIFKYGEILREQAEQQLYQLDGRMNKFQEDLDQDTKGIDELKSVLKTVNDIQASSMDVEIDYIDVVEKFRCLRMYKVDKVKKLDMELVSNLEQKWNKLVLDSKIRDAGLRRIKKKFKAKTQKEVQKFLEIVAEVRIRFTDQGPDSKSVKLEPGVKLMQAYHQEMDKLEEERAQIALSEKLFNLDPTSFSDLYFVQEKMEKLDILYGIYGDYITSIQEWSNMLWIELEVNTLINGIDAYQKKLKGLPGVIKELETFIKVEDDILGFKESIPLLRKLKTDSLRDRHWKELMKETGVTFIMDKSFTLANLFAMQLHRFKEIIDAIVANAYNEGRIENAIAEVKRVWNATVFSLSPYNGDESRGFLMNDPAEILLNVEDHALNIQSNANSPYAAPFLDQLRRWEKHLNLISETIAAWSIAQRKYMYLEGIFIGSDDIRMQLPDAAKRFDRVDTAFKKVMIMTNKNPNVLAACTTDGRLDELRKLSTEMDNCQKNLSDYLERKRDAFPRFFFISDDELLSILGSSIITSVQIHMLKLFENCRLLNFVRNDTAVNGMINTKPERFEFRNPVMTDGAVENWMLDVETEMVTTLRQITKEAIFNYAKADRLDWVKENLGMVTLEGSQVWWTWEVEDAFAQVKKGSKHAMKKLAAKLSEQLQGLVSCIRDPHLEKKNRTKINTLIIIDVHARDIIDSFVRDSILDAREFAWESQLRKYWDREMDDLLIRQCTGRFIFGYEYMGLNGRLVITPLTDRCYMTLTQALTFHLGGSPAGPAGTGKTETVKDLAKAMGLICIVTNCGEGLDYHAMGAIFSGLSQTGAWGCFDEFNRIDVEVLSVVSSQLRTIQNGLNMNKTRFDFVGREISLKPTVGFFVTMNPGYAGRTELPDNLKALFRPVTMIVPDLQQICEIMLFSEGFNDARSLAKKMTVLYKLSKEQLSKQFHYDFGLRALKSVLVMAGQLKRESPDIIEDSVLMRALRDMNAPKFVFDDVPLFHGLIADLFPGLHVDRVLMAGLSEAIIEDLTVNGFKHNDKRIFDLQVDKIVQMYETMLTRHTSMVVGPTQGGKSVVLNTLARAQQKAYGKTTKMFIMNPKSIPVHELYGVMDPVTRDWTDGLLSKMFRDCNAPLKEGTDEVRWIIFDGDVDALWVENMNSVMDDNRLLTLPNGERIRLENHCKMLVEVFDLQHASPATISRCGMVYVDPKNLGFKPFYERWVRNQCKDDPDDKLSEMLHINFEKYVPPCVEFVQEGIFEGKFVEGGRLETIIPQVNLCMVKQLCTLLDAIIFKVKVTQEELSEDEKAQLQDSDVVESVFIFCVVWSIGGALTEDSRVRFDDFLKELANRPKVNSANKSQVPEGPLYDFYFPLGPDSRDRWERWKAAPYVPPEPMEFHQILVPTVDTMRYTFLLESNNLVQKPLLFCGQSGTAKTVTIRNFCNNLDPKKYANLTINFSSRTSSLDVQNTIEASVEKRTGLIYGPAVGKSLIVFFDDLNMPIVDTYGTQQPIALLKFLVERGNMYDRSGDDSKGEALAKKTFKDLLYCASMAPPGGGRNPVDPRYIALFSVYSICFPSDESLELIYSTMFKNHVEHFSEEIKATPNKFSTMTLTFYKQLCKILPATPSKFHYVFNLRDLGRVYEGMLLSVPEIYKTSAQIVRLWRNECMRVFHDRVVSEEDQAIVRDNLLGKLIKENFGAVAETALKEPSLFGNFKDINLELAEGETRVQLYEDLGNYDTIKPILDQQLNTYNEENEKKMNLVLFQGALEHVTRIYRIIQLPRGNALLVGVGGSGKQSLTRLASFASGYKVFTINLARNYGVDEFREDLRSLYALLGATNGGSPVVFLFTDAHVQDERFLEMLNNMLTSGMVPALFNDDEKIPLCDAVSAEVKATGKTPNKENNWNFFVEKCRNNLHLVLAMSPAGDTLRVRCRNFPGLVNNTTIDWFFPWPPEALLDVATFFLAEEDLKAELRPKIMQQIVSIHQSVGDYSVKFLEALRRENHVTPNNFLDFIETYRRQLANVRQENTYQYDRLDGGLRKLIEAGESVAKFEIVLKDQKIIVDEKSTLCGEMIVKIKSRTIEVETKQANAEQSELDLKDSNARITIEKAEAEQALLEAEPALEQAADALKNLKNSDISEIKALKNPSVVVVQVVMCVVELKPIDGINPKDGWKAGQLMLSNAGFLNALKSYDKEAISEKMVKGVRAILAKKVSDPKLKLNIENLKRISTAAKGLYVWVDSIMNYYNVARMVQPRKLKVKKMEKDLAKSQTDLKQIKEELSYLQAEIKSLNDDYTEKSTELKGLEDEAADMERKLIAAQELIGGLGSEKIRWTEQRDFLGAKKALLAGDCLLAAGFLSYTGAFTFQFRKDMLDEWLAGVKSKEIPMSDPWSVKSLTTEVEISRWTGEGLPADELSIQNGILTVNASRWPLCIDPQMQASKWIKQKESQSAQELRIKTFNDGDFMKILELSIQFGNPYIFENVTEELDPVIDPVLEKNFVYNGEMKAVVVGDQTIDWNDNFRLYMITKLDNPKYSPEVAGKAMIINFQVTMAGLEDQLLDVVVGHERQDLQTQREELIQTISSNNITLVELENAILKELTSATGDILENTKLIETLKDAKTKSVAISKSLAESTQTAAEIEKTTSAYKPCAKRGAILFFTLAGLSAISTMYEFSLAAYLGVFRQALADAARDGNVQIRVDNVIDTLTKSVYDYTCTGIFEKHKLMFSLQLTTMIMDGEGRLNRDEMDFFLKGNLSLDEVKDPCPCDWILSTGWKDLLRLPEIKTGIPPNMDPESKFSTLVDDMKGSLEEWRLWYDLETPEEASMPQGYSKKLTTFQQLMLLRCLRPDRVFSAVKRFVIEQISDYFVQPPVLKYDRIFKQSSPYSPVVFILSPGADPQGALQHLAMQMDLLESGRFKPLALGQGQNKQAERLLEVGYSRGHWVILSNCHLLASWLKTLEKILQGLTKPHKDFRLWLTTDPTPKFPLGILQNALKVVTEPPDGLKLNMKGSYSRISQEELDSCPHEAYRPLVYVLAFFHAVVQERRKYGKLGWNVPYDFNNSDFDVSRRLLGMYLTKAHENNDEMIPWGSLRYLIGDAMYGGRVTDSFDRRNLNCYLQEYMGDFLFDENQKFYFSRKGFDYVIPKLGDLETYTDMIGTLPLDSRPTIFGLHSNAEIRYNSDSVKELWRNLIELQPRSAGGGGGTSREAFISDVAADIATKVPEPFDLLIVRRELTEKIKAREQKDDADSDDEDHSGVPAPLPPTTVVLLQELERWNMMVVKMASSLEDLQKALKGIVGMSNELDELADALFNGFLPASWRRLAPDTQKGLGSWMIHFLRRYAQYQKWVNDADDPKVIWLSGLSIPESYLTALVQTTCRRRQWPLDKSLMYTKVTTYITPDDISSRPVDGCYVEGLYLEGAAWDFENSVLKVQDPKVLVQDLPILQVIPIEGNKLKLQNTFRTPVYVTQARRNAMGVGLVFEADLASPEHPSHWILQGAALSLNTDS